MRKTTGFRFDFGRRRPIKRPTINQNDVSNTKTPRKKKRPVQPKIDAKTEIIGDRVIVHMPMITVSEANCFEHWTKKSDRHKMQRRVVASLINPVKDKIKLPCEIRFTRIAPRSLDCWDNLPMSVKYVLDAVCAVITGDFRPGRADDTDQITVSYAQKKSEKYGVIVEFRNVPSLTLPARNDETLD